MTAAISPTPNPFLFQPGSGLVPPYLAGREAEQGTMLEFLAALSAGAAPPSDIILIGPRGNGKTALLRWFEEQCREAGIDSLWLTPQAMPDLDSLATNLVPPSRFRLRLKELGINIAGFFNVGWAGEQPTQLTAAVTTRCRERPLAVLLDEAHTLDLDIGRTLLNTSQEVRGAGACFLLALAGTPDLHQHLRKVNASFWNRAEKLSIGRLTAEAAREALAIPLGEHGISFELAALDRVAADSQHYPYFIQLWGQALWRRIGQDGAGRIDAEVVDAAQPQVERV